MDKRHAIKKAVELASLAISATEGKVYPDANYADRIADFIERLAERLEKMDDSSDD